VTDDERVARTEAWLLQSCREAGAWISGDGRVGLDTACMLLGWSVQTMQNRISMGDAPPRYQIGGRGGRVTFNLRDLSEWVERQRVY